MNNSTEQRGFFKKRNIEKKILDACVKALRENLKKRKPRLNKIPNWTF